MKYIILWALALIVSFSSCLEDNTNLEYTQVILPDSVFVTNVTTGSRVACIFDRVINSIYNVQAGEELQLKPEVFYRGEDELVYEWQFGDNKQVISKEKDLRYTCTETGTLMLLIYRRSSGNATCYLFNVVVSSPFKDGFAILGKDEHGICFDFVQHSTESKVPVLVGNQQTTVTLHRFKEHSNVYPMYNEGQPLNMEEPVKIAYYRGCGYTQLKGLTLLDRQWQNSVTLDVNTMQKITAMKDEFIGEPADLRIRNFVPVGVMSLLLGESGKIYTRVNYDYGNPCTGKYSPLPLAYNDPKDVPDKGSVEINADLIIPIVNDFAPGALIYEKANRRFLVMGTVGMLATPDNIEYNCIFDYTNPTIPGDLNMSYYTDLNNVDKELVSAIQCGENSTEFLFLYRKAGEYYLQKNDITITAWSTPFSIEYSVLSCIKLSSDIATLLNNAGSSFNYKDGVIYFTSMNTLYSMTVTGQDLQTVFEFPQKDKIILSKIMVNGPWYNLSTALSANQIYNGRVFAAAFENGDLKVVQLYVNTEKNKIDYRFLMEKHYSGGVKDIVYYY